MSAIKLGFWLIKKKSQSETKWGQAGTMKEPPLIQWLLILMHTVLLKMSIKMVIHVKLI